MTTKYFILLIPLLTSCGLLDGIIKPEEPSLKGVFIPSATVPSVFTDNQVTYSMIVDSDKKGAFGIPKMYSAYVPGVEILIQGKRYKFYVDTINNPTAFVDFFIKEPNDTIQNKEGEWEKWSRFDAYEQIEDDHSLVFNKSGFSLYSDLDSIPVRLYGRSKKLDARIFLSIISSRKKITEPQYLPILLAYLKEDIATSKQRGIVKAFLDQGYDPIARRFTNEYSSLGVYDQDLKLLEVGKQVSLLYYEKTYEDVSQRFYSKEAEATNYSYLSEFYVMPGDSVWFTGRISGDSVIAFIKK